MVSSSQKPSSTAISPNKRSTPDSVRCWMSTSETWFSVSTPSLTSPWPMRSLGALLVFESSATGGNVS